jgi:hypothetical protein
LIPIGSFHHGYEYRRPGSLNLIESFDELDRLVSIPLAGKPSEVARAHFSDPLGH